MEEAWVSGVEGATKRLPNTLRKRREHCTRITPILFIYSTRLRRLSLSLSLSLWLFELANAQCTALVVVSRY
jgi:hypothetical protein